MGLFNNNYNRPGPGINKNQPKKKPFFLFFEIFFRKFWQLIQVNLLFCVPLILVGLLSYLLGGITSIAVVAFAPLILVSPFVAGITIVTRNYAREEHSFIFSDFIDAVKNNWLAFLVNGFVCYTLYFVISVALSYYYAQIKSNFLFMIPFALCIGISILLIFSQYYIPVMIITFDLKLTQIYRNAFIFSIIGLWRNLLLTVLLGVIIVGMYILFNLLPITLLIAFALVILNLFAFCMFLINFTVYPLIDKMMIQPNQSNKDEPNKGKDFND